MLFTDDISFIRTPILLNVLDLSTVPSSDIGRVSYPAYSKLESIRRLVALTHLSDEQLTIVGDDQYRAQRWTELYAEALATGDSVQSDHLEGLLVSNDVRLPVVSASDETVYNCSISNAHVAGSMLNFLLSPLLVDVFSLQMFTGVLYSLGLHGGASLCNSLPLLAVFFERLSMMKLTSFMTKQLAASPFQR